MSQIKINNRFIGGGQPVYVIAEMSANHGQSFEEAVKIIRAAKDCGADAVKLQTYTPDTLTIDCDKRYFQIGAGTVWEGKSLYDLYGEAYTPWEWQPRLKEVAEDVGLDLFSSPFDRTSVDFLERMNVPAYKVASFEIIDLPLIRYIASKRKPIIISTGMATLPEIEEAVSTAREAGADGLALLKCTSAYPSPAEEVNLHTIPFLKSKFNCPAGLSDHTLGTVVPTAAVAVGARIIEKHFTLSRGNNGPDSAFSLEPDEFRAMVAAVRTTEKALGHVNFGATKTESNSRIFRRSLFVVDDIKAGDFFSSANLRSIRPGDGLPPKYLSQIIGRRAAVDVTRGEPLRWEYVAEPELTADAL